MDTHCEYVIHTLYVTVFCSTAMHVNHIAITELHHPP